MKKLLSLLLAAAMLLSVGVIPTFADAAPGAVWNAAEKAFFLKDGPEIVRVAAESDINGTRVKAFFRHTADFKTLGDLYHAVERNDTRLFADALGLAKDNVNGDLDVGVQLAYSFDGQTWVNDFDTDLKEENPVYFLYDHFDLDGDGFEEYRSLPNNGADLDSFFEEKTLFDGRAGYMTPWYCGPAEGMSIQQALTIRNNTLLQGKGEYTGAAYKRDDANGGKGFAVDFNRHTLYVKARYRVYSSLSLYTTEDGWDDLPHVAMWSDWGPVKTYNNATASPEGQDCVPDVGALLTDAAPTLRILSCDRYDFEEDELKLKATAFRLGVDYPAAMQTALVRFYSLEHDVREELTGERYEPKLVYEVKVGNGGWYLLHSEDANDPYWVFDDHIVYWIPGVLEDLGYRPGDPVYLRVRLYGVWSFRSELGENVARTEKLLDSEKVLIRSGVSNTVELNLTGKYRISYETNCGSFPSGSHQLEQFDDDTLVNVDLTAKDYTPAQDHFTFDGWYTTENFAKGTEIKAFDTAKKVSRTYYAKWTELPFRTVTYDPGVITDSIYNPNPDHVYTDDGEITIEEVSYAGTTFLGWYDAAQGGSRVTKLSYAAMKGDVKLYARWDVPSKTITYAGAGKEYTNNAKNPSAYRINPTGSNETPIYAPEKTGYLFDGWFLNEDLTRGALPYSKEKGAYLLDESEDVTLYAKWIVGRWPVTYVLNLTGAWNGANPEQYTYGTAVTLEKPTRTGYLFNGWFADAGYKTEVKQIGAAESGAKTLYAKWTAIEYQIRYDLRDPQAVNFFRNPNPTVRTVDDEIVLQPLAPISLRYKFLGWYDNVNYDGSPIAKIAGGVDKDVTVYARLVKYSWGDVDFDGKVTSADARLVLRYSVKLEEFTPDMAAWGDVDGPSAERRITSADARLVLRMSVQLDTPESLKLPEAPEGFQ